MVKTLIEKLSAVHLQLVHSWQDLAKDVQRYSDEQHKKHKTVSSCDMHNITLQNLRLLVIPLSRL